MTFCAGPSSATLRGNTDFDNGRQFKLGYAAGVGIEQPIIQNLQVSFKLLYERKGDEHTEDIAFDPELQTYVYDPVRWETVFWTIWFCP
ncbi:MAG TPA: hypothetical protein VFW78_02360 [Bacteroidia bacterium]|nr:hypothetical protein [Bacteroidia bacterium]